MIHTRAERLRTARPSLAGRAALHLVPASERSGAAVTSDRWPDMPEKGIGALDAAAALGRDPFKSQVRLWMEKTHRQDLLHPVQREVEEAMYWGRLLEPIVAAHYTRRTGRSVRQTGTTVRHPRYPWMFATVTREVVASPEVELLECLCVGVSAAAQWTHGVPEHVRLRLLHLLAVTGRRAVDLAVLLGGEALQICRVERDDRQIAGLIRQERAFWRGVENDRAPPSQDEDVPTS